MYLTTVKQVLRNSFDLNYLRKMCGTWVELFFRWLKCVLGCKQLLTTSENGVALQIYTALIASLLIVLWTGRKPTKRTWEMLQFYFQGWASLEEVQAHLEKQKLIALKSQETDGPPKKT